MEHLNNWHDFDYDEIMSLKELLDINIVSEILGLWESLSEHSQSTQIKLKIDKFFGIKCKVYIRNSQGIFGVIDSLVGSGKVDTIIFNEYELKGLFVNE